MKRRIEYHDKQFDRYQEEVENIKKMKYVSKRNKNQKDYSYSWMCRHLDVYDELNLIKEKINNILVDEAKK